MLVGVLKRFTNELIRFEFVSIVVVQQFLHRLQWRSHDASNGVLLVFFSSVSIGPHVAVTAWDRRLPGSLETTSRCVDQNTSMIFGFDHEALRQDIVSQYLCGAIASQYFAADCRQFTCKFPDTCRTRNVDSISADHNGPIFSSGPSVVFCNLAIFMENRRHFC